MITFTNHHANEIRTMLYESNINTCQKENSILAISIENSK